MRRLDDLLIHATERGDRGGPDRLIEHLERRLRGEREAVVAGHTRRGTMVTTTDRPAPTEIPKQPWRRWAIALAGFAVVAAAVVVAVVMIGGAGDEDVTETDPIAVVQTFAETMRSGDLEALAALTPGPGLSDFMEWVVATGHKPVFTDCSVTGQAGTASTVSCVFHDSESFYAQVSAPSTSWVTGIVTSDGRYLRTDWNAPAGVVAAENAFREWIRSAHPELEDQMFGFDFAGVFKQTGEAGELHMQYLEEYLAYRALPPAPSPRVVMDRIADAVQAMDPAQFSDLSTPLASEWNRFLNWNRALRLDPVVSDCVVAAHDAGTTTVTCEAKSGTGYFFATVLGEELEGEITVNVADDGLATLLAWPAPPGLHQAEADFRDWILRVHPELEDRMFDSNALEGYSKMTFEAGELHMQYLDEYLEYLATNS